MLFFEKGWAYYIGNHACLAKMALFVAVALLSIYPTVRFLSWRGAVKQGQAAIVDAAKMRRMRTIIH